MSRPKPGPAASTSTLSSVVSSLVRAQIGTTAVQNVPDDDLDKHVADLILKEARQKEVRYFGKEGIRAYLGGNDNPKAKPNTRFLNTILKSTDDHNKAVLKAQADATAEYREAREKEERAERRRRAEEAVEARRKHGPRDSARHGSDRRERDRRKRSQHYDGAEEEPPTRRRRTPDTEDGYSREANRHKEGPLDHDEDDEARHRRHRDRRRRRSRSASTTRSASPIPRKHRDPPERESTNRKRRRSRSSDSPERRSRPHRERKAQKTRSTSPPIASTSKSFLLSLRPKATRESKGKGSKAHKSESMDENEVEEEPLSYTPVPHHPSKMDKYFAKDYDPRLDFTPVLSGDGFLPEGSFAQWDAMLNLVRLRREDKEDKKALQKSGSTSVRRGKADDVEDIFSIQYTRRGEVREWDEGKKVPT